MSALLYWQAVGALALVVALIGLCAWLARRFGLGGRLVTTGGKRRLSIIEVLPLDAKRRLVLLRRDEVEHLILLGQQSDTVIERGGDGEFAGLVERGAR
jgi:flagellar protein FliO/FliZ